MEIKKKEVKYQSEEAVADNSYYEIIYEVMTDILSKATPRIRLPYTDKYMERTLMSKDSDKFTKLEVLRKVIPYVTAYCDTRSRVEDEDYSPAHIAFKRQILDLYDKILTDEEMNSVPRSVSSPLRRVAEQINRND